MLASITPLGEWSRDQRWWLTTGFYVLGSAGGGAAFGALLGAAGSPIGPELRHLNENAQLVALAAVVAIGLFLDLRLAGLKLPTIHRQVRQDWLTQYRGWVYGLGFGFQLGMGVVTVVSTAAIYTTFIACFLSASVASGAVIGAIFGTIRASTLFSVRRVRTPEQLERVDPTLRLLEPKTTFAEYAITAAVVALIVTTVTVGPQ